MSERSFAEDIAKVEPRQTVVLSGYPDESDSRWNVNKAVQMGSPGEMTLAIVLQAADASEHWIAVILEETEAGWVIDMSKGFEGEKPANLSADDHGDDLDTASIEVVEIQAA